jgi:putative two-component system response regulator
VDVFDALTTERPYKKALSREEALQVMEDEVKRGWWDPDIFLLFTELGPLNVAVEEELLATPFLQ